MNNTHVLNLCCQLWTSKLNLLRTTRGRDGVEIRSRISHEQIGITFQIVEGGKKIQWILLLPFLRIKKRGQIDTDV